MDSSINNNISPNVKQNAAKIGTAGAVAGAVIGGGKELIRQKDILKHADEYIKTLEGEIAQKRSFNTPFFKGTQELADLANKQLDDMLAAAKSFVGRGKLDMKPILKKAGKVAGIAALASAGIYLLNEWSYAYNKKEHRDDSRILAEELKKQKVGEN